MPFGCVVTGLSIDNSKIFFFRQSIVVFVFFWGFLFWVVLVGEFLVQSVDRLFWVCFGLVLWVSAFSSFGLNWFFFFCDVHVIALEASAFCWTAKGIGCLLCIQNLII